VLNPGGRFAVSDVVADGPVPEELRTNLEAWVGCIAGALDVDTYKRLLVDAGFEEIGVEITRRYRAEDAGLDASALPAGWEEADGRIASAFIRARKPVSTGAQHPEGKVAAAGAGCCSGSCCRGE
jgi:hypothetical protein